MAKFEIDFFDLMWLAESVIPQRPIARSMCFDSFSEVHYHKMNEQQRKQFFEHVKKCQGFDLKKEQFRHFYARFNPKNQFLVTAFYRGQAGDHECYLFDNEFRTSKNTFVNKDYITKIVRFYDGQEFDKKGF